jgi:hypothetical protein
MLVHAPHRRRHAYTQTLVAPPEKVFPLLCPVREADWTPGWDVQVVLSESGVAEQDCIFVTPGAPHPAVWVVTRFEPEIWRLEFIKLTPNHSVCKIEIALAALGGARTAAHVAYTYTALGPAGDQFLEQFTEAWYRGFMEEWETALNHYVTTGRMLEG